MAELVVERHQLVVRLSWWERIVAVHGDVRVPLSSVESVEVRARARDAMKWFRPRYNGSDFMTVPYGVRLYIGGKGFIAAPRRRPAVLVQLDPPSRFAGLLVSAADPETTAARIMDSVRVQRRKGV